MFVEIMFEINGSLADKKRVATKVAAYLKVLETAGDIANASMNDGTIDDFVELVDGSVTL